MLKRPGMTNHGEGGKKGCTEGRQAGNQKEREMREREGEEQIEGEKERLSLNIKPQTKIPLLCGILGNSRRSLVFPRKSEKSLRVIADSL